MSLTLDYPTRHYLQCFFHSLPEKKRSSLQILRQNYLELISWLQILSLLGRKALFS